MASSAVDICNNALIKLGAIPESGMIASLGDDTKEARLCKERYDDCRRAVLSMHPWAFAKTRVALTKDATAPDFGYDNQITLPTDLLRIVVEEESLLYLDYRWEGKKLLTNLDSIDLVYLKDHELVTEWAWPFPEAVAWYLAKEISFALTQSSADFDRCDNNFERMLRRAKTMNAQQLSERVLDANEWLEARISYGGRIATKPLGESY